MNCKKIKGPLTSPSSSPIIALVSRKADPVAAGMTAGLVTSRSSRKNAVCLWQNASSEKRKPVLLEKSLVV